MLSAGMNNAVFPAIHPPPVEDGGLLAHGVLKLVDLNELINSYAMKIFSVTNTLFTKSAGKAHGFNRGMKGGNWL